MVDKIECLVCGEPAVWVRHTQFAGNHPYCEDHAKLEEDFDENDSYTYWTYNKSTNVVS